MTARQLNAKADEYSRLFKQTRRYHHLELAKHYRTEALRAEMRELAKVAK